MQSFEQDVFFVKKSEIELLFKVFIIFFCTELFSKTYTESSYDYKKKIEHNRNCHFIFFFKEVIFH